MTKLNRGTWKSLASRAAVLVAFATLAACGGGGGDSSPAVSSPTLATLAEVGVASVTVAGGASPVYLMTGKQEAVPVVLMPDAATSETDISISYAGKGVLPATKDANGAWQLQVDAAAMTGGEGVPVQITITNTKLNKYAVATAQLSFVTPTATNAKIGSAGGLVGPSESAVQILSNDLASPVGITVRRAVLPDGQTVLIDVALDADIGNATVPFLLPLPPPPPPVMATAAASATMRALAAGPGDAAALRLAWSQTTSYGLSDENIGTSDTQWLLQLAWFNRFPNYRLAITNGCLRTLPIAGNHCNFWVWTAIGQKASELNSIVPNTFDSTAWINFEPVLFVHGFSYGPLEDKLGGGRDTWKNLPALSQSTSLDSREHKLVPFEFRWKTNSSFRVAGRDLANAIQTIHRQTGKKVHIVAHSFGGILARTVLEGIAMPGSGSASDLVESLVTFGTPHSGISPTDGPMLDLDFPRGQDSILFEGCYQVSCYEMGVPVKEFSEKGAFSATGAGVGSKPGEIAVEVYDKSTRLPEIPIKVGIGLSAGLQYETGDRLISFAGQRFLPTKANGRTSSLMTNSLVPVLTGKATVTEFVLGTDPKRGIFPTVVVDGVRDRGIGWRTYGYFHSTGLLFPSRRSDAWDTGIEPGPVAGGCGDSVRVPWTEDNAASADFCDHAGYRAFAQLMKEIYPVKPPTPSFSASTLTPQIGQLIAFDASASTDVGATIIGYEWNFGDGQAGTGRAPNHSYLKAATYVVTLTVAADDGQRASTSKRIVVSAVPPHAMKFIDNFDGASLDLNKWTVSKINGGGNLATFVESNGFLNVTVPGGSCGFCGVSDGAQFRPIIAPLIGDFELIVSGEEIERISRDRSKPISSVYLSMAAGGTSQIAIFIIGDVLNNQGLPGHGPVIFYQIGTVASYPMGYPSRNLAIGQYYAFQFRVRRVGNIAYLAYRISLDETWTEVTLPTEFPAANLSAPTITIGSGDGGGTGVNSSFKAKLDFVSIQ